MGLNCLNKIVSSIWGEGRATGVPSARFFPVGPNPIPSDLLPFHRKIRLDRTISTNDPMTPCFESLVYVRTNMLLKQAQKSLAVDGIPFVVDAPIERPMNAHGEIHRIGSHFDASGCRLVSIIIDRLSKGHDVFVGFHAPIIKDANQHASRS